MVRWKEAVWVEKGRRKKRLIKVGERQVTVEVLTTDQKGCVSLTVLKCEILANLAARVLEPYKKGELLRRARRTIGRGSGERLAWSDEDARAHVTSKFLD
ncbi:MAG: hypothetical protein O2968_21045 [Acidobacteria bacterium]|nr:hypothetical protein [Acidobacteriota bacterium]